VPIIDSHIPAPGAECVAFFLYFASNGEVKGGVPIARFFAFVVPGGLGGE